MDHESSQYFHIAKNPKERIARRRLQRSEEALLQEQEVLNRKENDEKKQHFGSKNDAKSVKIACSLPLLPP
jgi:hypothetical protein